jgi:hypothetical protein
MGRASRLNFQPRSSRQPLPNPGLVGPGGSVIDTRPPVLLDSYGRALQVGDGVVLQLARPPIFRVVKCEPAKGEGVPAGMMDIVATCMVRFIAPRAQPQSEFLMVMDDQEMAAIFGGPVTEQQQPKQPDVEITRPADEEGDDHVG